MAAPEPAYFLTLAQIAIAFVAFTSLVVVLRQTRGGAITVYERLAMTFNIETGFVVLWFAMAPPLFGLPQDYTAPVWRVFAGIQGAFTIAWLSIYLYRRKRALKAPFPVRMLFFTGSVYLFASALILDATGIIRTGDTSLYAIALTWGLAASCVGFVLTLPYFIDDDKVS